MIRILAVAAFILSLIFYVWSLGHGTWNWAALALLGFIFLSLDNGGFRPRS